MCLICPFGRAVWYSILVVAVSFPGCENVHWISDPGGREFRVDLDLSFDEALDALRGDWAPDRPVTAKWVMGRHIPDDFVWTRFAIPIIVSSRVVSVFEKGRFTGWSTYPVTLFDRRGAVVEGFEALVVTGRTGPMQLERSAEVVKPGPTGRPTVHYRGLLFDESLWDGSDVFMSSDRNGTVFLTREVRNGLLEAGVTGAFLQQADQDERLFRQ
jgi:hypothetical protein